MQVIDAHHHLWALDTPGHMWPGPAEPTIHRDFGIDDLIADAGDLPLASTVLVQSQPTDADTDWLLGIAAASPTIGAVVGWVDLAASTAPARIAALAENPKLRGLRPMLQGIADTDWLLGPTLESGLRAMLEHGLRLDALVQPRHLPMLARFVDRWPGLPVVIDHGAKPFIASGVFDPWRDDIAALAGRGFWCKLSGLRTEQLPGAPVQDLAPYVEHLVVTFGARLMWGSDWPVLHLAGDSPRQWFGDADRLARRQGAARERLFAGAAREFYGLEC
ncbi:amidohydrolase family protein [Sphingomonas phyllosphaerae]|uniref:amidohydrolase family protein n=1 Tax=Sphingomonas phyllosphaerae TaxID=257003 RepID=UPI0003B680A5|nr:amidohydrolase family protein [Sphingomonas phyllosphaerae]